MGQPRQPVASSIGAITSEVEGTTREQNLCWLGEAGQLLEEDGGPRARGELEHVDCRSGGLVEGGG